MSIIKQLLFLVVLAGACVGGYFGYQHYYVETAVEQSARKDKGRGGPADRVEVVEAKFDTIRDTIEAVGTSRAFQAIEVVVLASGRIVEISAGPGQEVRKGQPLLRLDDDIEKANLAEAKAKLLKANSFLERSRTLRESKFTSQASLDQVRADAASAEAEVGRAERRLADRVVRAAFDGRVGLNRVEVGARVDSNTILTTLDDISKVEIEFQLPEVVFGRTKVGMTVLGESVAFPGQIFTGTIAHVDTRIDRTSRTFLVRAQVPNPDRRLPAGMFMRLSLVLEERKGLIISEESVIVEGNTTFVFVVHESRAHRRTVKLGQRRPGLVEIAEGLKPGDRVVTRGLERLRDGKAVRIVGGPGANAASAVGGDQRKIDGMNGGKGGSGSNGQASASQLGSPTTVVDASVSIETNGPVSAIANGGQVLMWRLQDGNEVKVNLSGSRTKVTIDGKLADHAAIRIGMSCRARASGQERVADTVDCKDKSGA